MTKNTNKNNKDETCPLGQERYDDLWERPGFLVRRLHQIHIGLFADACGTSDLTAVQYAILSVLFANPGLDQLTLSRAVGIDRTSGADVIRRLVKRGLVDRSQSELDRRAQVVTLTDEGRAIAREVRPMMEAAQDALLAPLSEKDQRSFMKMLRHLVLSNNEASRAPMS